MLRAIVSHDHQLAAVCYVLLLLALSTAPPIQADDSQLILSWSQLDSPAFVKTDQPVVVSSQPDWVGVRHDVYSFLVLQGSILAMLYAAPESVSGWTDEQREEYSLDEWKDNVQRPVWDTDDWWINYLLHPYWGATYYIRGRERGLDRSTAFWFSALLSTLYEYGGEALFEEPSIQDLIVTPVGGTLLGFWFERKRQSIEHKGENAGFGDRAFIVLSDPMGAVNRRVSSLIGKRNPRLRLSIRVAHPHGASPAATLTKSDNWGLQIGMHW